MSVFNKIRSGIKAARFLGVKAIFLYGLYQVELSSGWIKDKTNRDLRDVQNIPFFTFQDLVQQRQNFSLNLPIKKDFESLPGFDIRTALDEAGHICRGFYRQFGADLVKINLNAGSEPQNWTGTRDDNALQDLKFIWEPARFGWVYALGRAYILTGENSYPQAFWELFESFRQANPPYSGPNWASGQEAGLRILALTFAWQVFRTAELSTPERLGQLAQSLAEHAARIPAGLIYARAQRNNHLLTEAAGLYTAGILLEGINQAEKWKTLGWKWLNKGIQDQISTGGTYSQHSMNYHRLMLQTTLWVKTMANSQGQNFPPETLNKLKAATRWLVCQVDPTSGKAPNLGSNDGANILPLSTCEFQDFRSTAQAAGQIFLGRASFPSGPWDEMTLWLLKDKKNLPLLEKPCEQSDVYRIGDRHSWASLRVVNFSERPSHADLLHVDLWFAGKNITLDAGTYRYTALPPWDNSLAKTCVHNTICINNQDQMSKAGRFLWLDWAKTKTLKTDKNWIIAEHDGYKKLGITHRREIFRKNTSTWLVNDYLLPLSKQINTCNILLHWLLPDAPWNLDQQKLQIVSHPHRIELSTNLQASPELNQPASLRVHIVRAGQTLLGEKEKWPLHGWFSPTYSVKEPALSYLLEINGVPPIALQSKWILSTEIT